MEVALAFNITKVLIIVPQILLVWRMFAARQGHANLLAWANSSIHHKSRHYDPKGQLLAMQWQCVIARSL